MAGTGAPRSLSPAEWEALIDEYNLGGATRIHRWTDGSSVFDLCISSLLRRDLSIQLKLHLLTFLEQHTLDDASPSSSSLNRLVDALRGVIQSPTDPFALKEQFLISSTSIFITSLLGNDELSVDITLCSLVELLLTIINRPNHGVDRHTRGIACECLRQLELAFPCLLSEITPHLWSLCQSERTHVSQWYVLLLLTAVSNVVKMKPGDAMISSISNAAIPLIPFNLPLFLVDGTGQNFSWKEKELSFKELRRVVAFFLDFPQYLTPFGLLEFIVALIPIAEELELQASLLKVQFSWLLYTNEPLLYHTFLVLFLKFLESFEGQEFEVAPRLLLLSKETQHHLVFRLLGLQWLLGFFGLIVGKDEAKKRGISEMSLKFYPDIYDPLALKALKLDALAYCSSLLCSPGDASSTKEANQVKLFTERLLSVSDSKCLPPWSSEAAVAFRAFHKFLIVGSPHKDATNSLHSTITESRFFRTLMEMLVNSILESPGLVPVVVASIDRLLGCCKHCWLGEHLLEALDVNLLPKLKQDYSLGSYFLIFERISRNDEVPPNGLLKLLMNYMLFLVMMHGPGTELKSWRHGSKILNICRTLLKYHHSSSLFTSLTRLLASVCLYFPDLEIRDNARFYLRMLTCIPGRKLKSILNKGEVLPGVSPSNYSGSPFDSQSFSNPKRPGSISSVIHIERTTPLLIKQSWSLALLNFGIGTSKSDYFEGIRDSEPANEEGVSDMRSNTVFLESGLHPHPGKEPLRVMDAKVSEIVRVLRRHFSCVPDYRHAPGLKIYIRCRLRFDSGLFSVTQEVDTGAQISDEVDNLPALYAIVLRFTSSAPYGSIPSIHIPFLLGTPVQTGASLSQVDSLAIVPAGNHHSEEEKFCSPLCIELEPREPTPGLVNVWIDSNADNGRIIQGQLHSISVGIEDMFLRAISPDDIQQDASCDYYMHLFNALWEACESSSGTGRETFLLKGGKGAAAINGTRSVKLIEIPSSSVIQAIEHQLAPFVVCVIGEALVDVVKSRGVIKDTVWKVYDSPFNITSSPTGSKQPLYLKYLGEEEEAEAPIRSTKNLLGYLNVLIFLPPRFHLLFQMEVREFSTLVRIRTDHWPCLAYVDDYLEALFLE